MDCIKNIIGLSRTEDECFIPQFSEEAEEPGEEDPWYMISMSGLYLDELEGSPTLKAIKSIGKEKVGKVMDDARRNAIKTFNDDLLVALSARYEHKAAPYIGNLGEKTFTRNLSIEQAKAGLLLKLEDMRTALHIKNITLLLDTTATVDVEVVMQYRRSKQIVPLHVFPGLNAVAGVATPNVVNYKVSVNEDSPVNLLFLYDVNGMHPKDNKVSCGCGNKDRLIGHFAEVKGVSTSDYESLSTSKYANGLMITVDMRCDAADSVCKIYERSEQMATVMAYAIRYKAGELLIEALLNTTEVSRNVMSDREHWWGKRNHFRSEYIDRINWMVENMSMDFLDCYKCGHGRMYRAGIRA